MIKLLIIVLSVLNFASVTAYAELNSDFGRLFSKPTERERLDKLRQNQQLKVISAEEASPEPDVESVPIDNTSPITMQGYVKRNDGKSTLWINNQPVQEGDVIDNVQVGRINRKGYSSKSANTEGVDIQVPGSGKRIRLKAGQMYEPETSQIKEMQLVEKLKQLKLEEMGTTERGVVE